MDVVESTKHYDVLTVLKVDGKNPGRPINVKASPEEPCLASFALAFLVLVYVWYSILNYIRKIIQLYTRKIHSF